ncbi:MAG: LysE family transporter [Anaerolineales bacterium]|uniref:LysE family transporter n=1 Tax=Candidatus Villigracilis vicinus TaxID=3140679 RepID=UPI0031372EBC|nr:LysE family transporter [Anaerolineales bacterium]
MTPLLISSFFLALSFCAPPGVITAETFRRGSARGFFPALFVQLGSLIGDTTWALIALTGLAFLIQNTLARTILSLIGIFLMVKLAWDALKDARHGKGLDVSESRSNRGDFASGAFLSLGNPMNIVFWTGLGTSVFASITGGPEPIHFAIFFAGFLSGAILWCFVMAGLVAWGRQWMTGTFFRFLNAACGLILFYFAFQLGLQTVQSFI